MVSVSTGPSTWTPIVLPTVRSFLLAVDVSMTTSSAPGHFPSTSVRELNWGLLGSTENPRFGAPPKTIALPSFTRSVLSLATPPIASATSGRSWIVGSSDSSNDASLVPEPSPVSNGDFGVIVASVPR